MSRFLIECRQLLRTRELINHTPVNFISLCRLGLSLAARRRPELRLGRSPSSAAAKVGSQTKQRRTHKFLDSKCYLSVAGLVWSGLGATAFVAQCKVCAKRAARNKSIESSPVAVVVVVAATANLGETSFLFAHLHQLIHRTAWRCLNNNRICELGQQVTQWRVWPRNR